MFVAKFFCVHYRPDQWFFFLYELIRGPYVLVFQHFLSDVSPLGWSMMISWRRRINGLCVAKEHKTTIFDKAPVVNKKSAFA